MKRRLQPSREDSRALRDLRRDLRSAPDGHVQPRTDCAQDNHGLGVRDLEQWRLGIAEYTFCDT
jgi:hypothetical protein